MDFALHEPVVTVEDAVVRYGAKEALSGVSFSLDAGRILAVVGANGAGKSTLFRVLAGLVALESGRVTLFGHSAGSLPRAVRERVAYVSETHAEVPEATVRELCAFRRAMYRSFDSAAFDELIDGSRVGWNTRFGALSRGQRALVAVGLALAQTPDLLLLDDPTLGLDPLARRTVVQAVLRVARRSATTVVLATHDVADVERVADDLLFLSRGSVACPVVELAQFVARSSAITVERSSALDEAIESIDAVVYAWPRRHGVEVVLSGEDDEREGARVALSKVAGEELVLRDISLEEAALAWLARDAERQVSHG
ncbi:MAG: ABC transporter ATP-binding protein [Myxococcales bacterium]|nr:ABC transporter ATP-binding protein [Myxococcales bacterium]